MEYETDHAAELHKPDRAQAIHSLEEHLNIAARLTRALWELARSPDLQTEDVRSQEALEELASAAADHASAARYVFYTQSNPEAGR